MVNVLVETLNARFGDKLQEVTVALDGMVTVTVLPAVLLEVAHALHDEQQFDFKLLIDVCGVDYIDHGASEWRTTDTTGSGYSRGQTGQERQQVTPWTKSRFASVYHLLSVSRNQRLRVRVFLDDDAPKVPSVCSIWNSANWFEREAFDLFGIIYDGHPDLRRLLTDYGFVGHPFRKDFPLVGEVELRYDAAQERCVYQPVSIQPRVNVPKVIRDDHRYLSDESKE